MKKLSVLMSVHNESRTLRTIVKAVLESPVGMEIELICVDDASTDESLEILRALSDADDRIRVISHNANSGKGHAIRAAIEEMTGDVAIIQDADLEYDPADFPRVLAPILDGKADAVFGSRFASSEVRRVLFFWHALGNRLLTGLANMAYDLNLTDMETCYKAMRADVLKQLRLTSNRFGLEPEITARLAQWGARIYEVPISYHGRTYAEGKSIGWRDALEAIWLILKYRFFDTSATNQSSVVTRLSLGKAKRYRSWLMDRFEGHVGDAVLEANAGPGHTTWHLINNRNLVASDDNAVHVETLRRRFGQLENVGIELLELEHNPLGEDRFDTVLLFDGLQRAQDPKNLLANVAAGLRPGGKVLIKVPADISLYGSTDKAAGHLRRFSRDELENLIRSCGLEILHVEGFNLLGAIGWRLHHALGRGRISTTEALAFDLAVPFARRLDAFVGSTSGLSWIAVARIP